MKSKILAGIMILTMIIGYNHQSVVAQIDFREKIGESSADTPTYKLNNFLGMRKELEKLTSTEVAGLGGFGPLYVTYKQAVQEKKAKEKIYYDKSILHSKIDTTINDNKIKLAQIAKNTFTDISGNESYAHLIPSAVYYGMISGYGDGTFKGDKSMSYAEFSSLLGNYNGIRKAVEKGDLSGQWYSQTIGLIKLDYANIYNLDKENANSNISRGEVALIIATNFFSDELKKAYDIAGSQKGRNYFSDINRISSIGTKEYDRMTYSEIRQWYLNNKNSAIISESVLAAMVVLKDKGVMVGDTSGNSNWNKDIARVEVLTLMYKLGCLD